MSKRLYLSRSDRKIAGVCGGAGEYLNIDSTVVRVVYILVTIFTGVFLGMIAYLLLWVVIPNPPQE